MFLFHKQPLLIKSCDYLGLNFIKATVHELPSLHLEIAYTKYIQPVRGQCSSISRLRYRLHFRNRNSISGRDLPVSNTSRTTQYHPDSYISGLRPLGLRLTTQTPSNSKFINEWIYTATATFAFIVCARTNLLCNFNFIPDNIIVT
jgi:hypothetical protein